MRQWSVAIPAADWHGTVEAGNAYEAKVVATRAAREEGAHLPYGFEVYVTYAGMAACPACAGAMPARHMGLPLQEAHRRHA